MKMISRLKTHRSLLVLSTLLLILGATPVFLRTRKPSESSAKSLFERVVISPIPESVRDIRASCPLDKGGRGWTEHTYIFRFDIGRADSSKIIASGSFVERKVVYKNLYLLIIDPNVSGSGVKLYATDREVPDWFDLPQWKGFTAYYGGTERPVDMYIQEHLLLYNEDLGRAYFVDHEATGERPRWWLFPFYR